MCSCAKWLCVVSGSLVGLGAMTSGAIAHDQPDVSDTIRRSVQQRAHTPRADVNLQPDVRGLRGTGPASFPSEYRTIDGLYNNLANPLWGAAATDMMRMMDDAYPLSSGEVPARAQGPSARAVSNAVNAAPGLIYNSVNASDFLWQWGQFLDHDVDETPVGTIPMDIAVPAGDASFDPMNTGTMVIGMHRSAFHMDFEGHRQQVNEITSFIDASNVYGSEYVRSQALRTKDGTGRMRTSAGDLLPFNTGGLNNAPTPFDPTMFVAGDVRVNEQVGLTAMHTLFVREHNYWADQFAIQFPQADDDELFERARAVVAAEMQAITFNEFLPVLLGVNAMGSYQGYDAAAQPMVSNEFAAAAYRMGHTMLSPTLKRLDATDQEVAGGHLPLQSAFFIPSQTVDNGIDSILRGLASQQAQQIDTYIVDDVRNFLFGPPGAGGFDLASLNIQRGRDHGLPDFNSLRVLYGGVAATSFDDVSNDPAIVNGLASVYASVDEIDPWVGLLAEPAVGDSLVGVTLNALLVEQFNRLRHADRFWYEAYLPTEMVEMINEQTLATIIRRNTEIGAELSDDVFQASAPCPADVNNDGSINFFDISEFLGLFIAQDPRVDFASDESINFFDVSAFLSFFQAGCP